MQEQIFSMIFEEDEITWQSMLYKAMKSEEMDPWDIDISLLAKKFLEQLGTLKEVNFRFSGKIILAAAIMLKIKSNRLLNEDLNNLDRLFAASEEGEDSGFLEQLEEMQANAATAGAYMVSDATPELLPRTPQPRKRKVSIFDLMHALEKALEVQNRRVIFLKDAKKMEAPKKGKDISVVIGEVYEVIKAYFNSKKTKKLTFADMLQSTTKEDKVYTFIPLLHLTNQRLIDLAQEDHFGEIEIKMLKAAPAPAKITT